MTYHLLNDFGVYKQSLKRNFYSNDRGREHDDVLALLEKRTQWYTIDELVKLFGFLWTAHDECVSANPDEYNNLQVRAANDKIEFGRVVLERLRAMGVI